MNNVLRLFQIISAPLFCRTNLSPPQRLLLGIHNYKVASARGRRERAFFFPPHDTKKPLRWKERTDSIVFTEIPQCLILEYTLPVSKVCYFFSKVFYQNTDR